MVHPVLMGGATDHLTFPKFNMTCVLAEAQKLWELFQLNISIVFISDAIFIREANLGSGEVASFLNSQVRDKYALFV